VATRHRKTRRLRASRTHGWGRSGQHRGSGSQGGHGNAGWKRHRWSAVIRYGIQIAEPGFKSPNQTETSTINIGQITEKINSLIQQGYAKQSHGKLEIELGRAGYTKLLSQGQVDQPLLVTVEQFSKRAAEKISQAGGEIISPNKQKEG
jgi:large subunit ribosomal protein L15